MFRFLTLAIVLFSPISFLLLIPAIAQAQSPAYVPRVAWSPAGDKIAVVQIVGSSAGNDDIIDLYTVDQNTLQYFGRLPNPSRGTDVVQMGNIAFSPDGTRLAVVRAVAGESVLEIWDVTTSSFQLVTEYFDDEISRDTSTALAWRPGHDEVAMSNRERIVLVDATTGSVVRAFEGQIDRAFVAEHIDWSPDGSRLLGEEAPAFLWDGDTGNILTMLQADYYFQPAVWSPDGSQIVAQYKSESAEYSDSLRIWDANTLQPLTTLPGGILNFPKSIDWQGKTIAVLDQSSQGAILKFWDGQTFELLSEVQLNEPLDDFALSPNGQDFVYADASGTLTVHNFPISNAGPDQTVTDTNGSGTETVTLDGTASSDPDGTIAGYEWSENGNIIATGATPQVTLSVGVHTITLTVTDNDGLTATDDVVITVEAGTTPTATPMPPAGCWITVNSGDAQALINAVTFVNMVSPTMGSICLHEGTYTLTAVHHANHGANGLPVITKPITLRGLGSGAIIERDSSAPAFRFFFVSSEGLANGELTLENVTLVNGEASGTAEAGYGGAIYSQGPLTITDSTFNGNSANSGGAIYNDDKDSIVSNSCIAGNIDLDATSADSGIYSNTQNMDAENNWWGAADGPSGAGSGSGDAVNNKVDFTPFLTAGCPN